MDQEKNNVLQKGPDRWSGEGEVQPLYPAPTDIRGDHLAGTVMENIHA